MRLEVGLDIGGDWWKTKPSLHLETVRQWELVLHVHWEDAAGVKGLQPIYTEGVSQPSSWLQWDPAGSWTYTCTKTYKLHPERVTIC